MAAAKAEISEQSEKATAQESAQSALATLGTSLAAGVELVATCRDCLHQAVPDLAGQAARYGAALTLPEWGKRLRCSQCGSRDVDFIVRGYRPPSDDWA